jgi:hypothetical protein
LTEEGVEAKSTVSSLKEADDPTEKYTGYMDSNSEDSDSDLSGKEVDSDIENEKEKSYDRSIARDDLIVRINILVLLIKLRIFLIKFKLLCRN